jgi:hypothetical protein
LAMVFFSAGIGAPDTLGVALRGAAATELAAAACSPLALDRDTWAQAERAIGTATARETSLTNMGSFKGRTFPATTPPDPMAPAVDRFPRGSSRDVAP